ncbi:MAG: hypothetical protein A2W35_02965 [Chloroflexi bacterium RBG_16_57_11]|nr:MAG: hypothetical protein A2W35_02965 [Chloroflexi bacterium RBG_16_57_11]
MKYGPQKHHRRTIRLRGYDYSQPEAYFVTICSYLRESLFGQIVDGQMQLSPLGEIVKHEWFRSAQIRHEIVLHADEFVIMPNHLHGIVHFVAVGADGVRPGPTQGIHPSDADDTNACDTGAHKPGAQNPGAHRAPLPSDDHSMSLSMSDPVGADGIRPDEPDVHDPGAHRAPLRMGRSLASFVAGFKSAVTSYAGRELNLSNVWQRNYYEHIIRDEAEYTQINAYIQTNPLRWEADQLYPSAAPNPFNQE